MSELAKQLQNHIAYPGAEAGMAVLDVHGVLWHAAPFHRPPGAPQMVQFYLSWSNHDNMHEVCSACGTVPDRLQTGMLCLRDAGTQGVLLRWLGPGYALRTLNNGHAELRRVDSAHPREGELGDVLAQALIAKWDAALAGTITRFV